jgi:hypothetical protein
MAGENRRDANGAKLETLRDVSRRQNRLVWLPKIGLFAVKPTAEPNFSVGGRALREMCGP